eukprot:158863_1
MTHSPLCAITLISVISYALNLAQSQSSIDICVTGNDNTAFDGTYTWLKFGEKTSSIYYCNECERPAYLYRTSDTWRIGDNYTSDASLSYCSENYTLNPIDCNTWNTYDINASKWNNPDYDMDLMLCQTDPPTTTIPITTTIQSNACIDGEWFDNINQQIIDCNNICISGNDNEDLNGEYIWQQFDYQSN